ncbi:MAG: peptidoglycan-binding domain-containing protein [Nitrospinae bacterium]|nr:peptidoglycan-binding domain-containing protein [Nitrospinota bacterium]
MKSVKMWGSPGYRFAVSILFFALALQVGISSVFANDMVRRAQETLAEKGFDPGPVDGIWGAKTKSGVMKFQESEGLLASGQLDKQTKNRLFSSVSESAPAETHSSAPTSSGVYKGNTGVDVPDSEIVWGRHKK